MKTKLFKRILELELTFSQVASKLDKMQIKPTTIFHWADGRKVPNAREKKALAKVLDCKVSDIF